jgi:ribosomal protein S27E
MGFLRRQATAWFGEPEQRPLAVCPHCGSELVQPLGWKELPDGELFLRLQCPDCDTITSGAFQHERVADYDAALVKGKEQLLGDYEAVVRHNMGELAELFQRALELDLVGADDFRLCQPCFRSEPALDRSARRVESIWRR